MVPDACHTTNGPPTIGPPGPSAAAMDGPPGLCTAATLGPWGDHLRHLASPHLVPPATDGPPPLDPFTGVAAS